MFQEIIKNVLPSTVIIAAVAWLARELIKHILTKDIAGAKSKIEADAKKQIELYKSEIEIERSKLQTRYSGIFDKQAEAILKLYRSLEKFSRKAELALGNAGSNQNAKEDLKIQFYELKDTYSLNRIFLPQDLDTKYEKLFVELFKNVWTYSRYEEGMKYVANDEKFNKIWEKQEKALNIVQVESPIIKNDLTNRFRFLLGIE